MRLRRIETVDQANHFLERTFLPWWHQRFARRPRDPRDAHRHLEREHRLEQILSIRETRSVAWLDGTRWDSA